MSVLKFPNRRRASATSALLLGTVIEARDGEALRLRPLNGGSALSVDGHAASVCWLEVDDTVLLADLPQGVVVTGRLRVPGEMPPVLLKRAPDGSIHLTSETEIVLRCGDARITLGADGKIGINGREIHTNAEGRLVIDGKLVEIN